MSPLLIDRLNVGLALLFPSRKLLSGGYIRCLIDPGPLRAISVTMFEGLWIDQRGDK